AVRRGEKALPPELDAAAAVRRRLEADAIDGEHEAAVRDRVAPLYRLPRRVLPLAVLGLLLGMPTDRSRVDQELRAAQRREPCRLRIPLIPADEHAELGGAGRERPKAQVARREIELLVVARIVRNVHLPVLADVAAPTVEHGGRIVEEPRGPPLEQARDDRHVELRRDAREALGRRAGDGLRELELRRVLGLAEVAGPEELRQHDELRALCRRVANEAFRA